MNYKYEYKFEQNIVLETVLSASTLHEAFATFLFFQT